MFLFPIKMNKCFNGAFEISFKNILKLSWRFDLAWSHKRKLSPLPKDIIRDPVRIAIDTYSIRFCIFG